MYLNRDKSVKISLDLDYFIKRREEYCLSYDYWARCRFDIILDYEPTWATPANNANTPTPSMKNLKLETNLPRKKYPPSHLNQKPNLCTSFPTQPTQHDQQRRGVLQNDCLTFSRPSRWHPIQPNRKEGPCQVQKRSDLPWGMDGECALGRRSAGLARRSQV